MREQFDISGVFETTEFEIAKVACRLNNYLYGLEQLSMDQRDVPRQEFII